MNHKERKHSWLSPSGLKPIVDGCIGKPFLEKEFPERPAGTAAEYGTAIHELAEKFLTQSLVDASAYDSTQIEVATHYVEYVRAIASIEEEAQLFTEIRVDVFPEYEISGTSDSFIYLPASGTLHIVDLKTGRIPVFAEKNPQLIAYMKGFLSTLRDPVVINELVFHIVQPGNSQDPWTVPYHTFNDTYVVPLQSACKSAYEIYTGIREINHATDTRINDGCVYCRAQSKCTTFREHIKNETLVLLDDYPISIPRVEDLTPEQRVRVFKASKLITSYLENNEELIKKELAQGIDYPDLTLAAGKTVRKWASDTEYVAKNLSELGLEPYRQSLITITEAEKILKKKKALLPDDIFEHTQQAQKLVVKDMKHLDLLEDI